MPSLISRVASTAVQRAHSQEVWASSETMEDSEMLGTKADSAWLCIDSQFIINQQSCKQMRFGKVVASTVYDLSTL
jgi:hypothetical protein